MAYFTADELQNRIGKGDFSATTFPTTTMVTDMATELSAMWDGLAQQTEGTETPDEFVKQACLSAAVYQVGQMRAGEPIDPLKQQEIMKNFMNPVKKTTLHYSQDYPDSTGEW